MAANLTRHKRPRSMLAGAGWLPAEVNLQDHKKKLPPVMSQRRGFFQPAIDIAIATHPVSNT
jgi:hypothetical protein